MKTQSKGAQDGGHPKAKPITELYERILADPKAIADTSRRQENSARGRYGHDSIAPRNGGSCRLQTNAANCGCGDAGGQKVSLTPKQKLFVAEYLAHSFNATQAAVSAGYSASTAQEQGSRLLSNVMVAAEIERQQKPRLERLGVTAERVLEELALLAFSNMLDYITINSEGLADINLSKLTRDQAAAIQEISVDMTGGSGDGKRELVPRLKFKLASKRDSLELLGKHLKLFTDKLEVSGTIGLADTIAEARKRVAKGTAARAGSK